MKLTEKDKTFLETLRKLMDSKDLRVELKPDRPSSMVLRGTYGEKIHRAFRMTRQGVRWRVWRLFNDIYVSAFETILSRGIRCTPSSCGSCPPSPEKSASSPLPSAFFAIFYYFL